MATCKTCIHSGLCADMHKFGIVDLPYDGDGAVCDHFKPTADVVERSVLEKLLENAMAIPKPMHLYIYFADEHVEKHMVTRFTDLSQTKSQFYYYEEPHHEPGKGKTFRRDEIKCFEVSFCPKQDWEQHLVKE